MESKSVRNEIYKYKECLPTSQPIKNTKHTDIDMKKFLVNLYEKQIDMQKQIKKQNEKIKNLEDMITKNYQETE